MVTAEIIKPTVIASEKQSEIPTPKWEKINILDLGVAANRIIRIQRKMVKDIEWRHDVNLERFTRLRSSLAILEGLIKIKQIEERREYEAKPLIKL